MYAIINDNIAESENKLLYLRGEVLQVTGKIEVDFEYTSKIKVQIKSFNQIDWIDSGIITIVPTYPDKSRIFIMELNSIKESPVSLEKGWYYNGLDHEGQPYLMSNRLTDPEQVEIYIGKEHGDVFFMPLRRFILMFKTDPIELGFVLNH